MAQEEWPPGEHLSFIFAILGTFKSPIPIAFLFEFLVQVCALGFGCLKCLIFFKRHLEILINITGIAILQLEHAFAWVVAHAEDRDGIDWYTLHVISNNTWVVTAVITTLVTLFPRL